MRRALADALRRLAERVHAAPPPVLPRPVLMRCVAPRPPPPEPPYVTDASFATVHAEGIKTAADAMRARARVVRGGPFAGLRVSVMIELADELDAVAREHVMHHAVGDA